MEYQYNIYIVTDCKGDKHPLCVDGPSDTIMICVPEESGSTLCFESEAYHLSTWCENHGLSLDIKSVKTEI